MKIRPPTSWLPTLQGQGRWVNIEKTQLLAGRVERIVSPVFSRS